MTDRPVIRTPDQRLRVFVSSALKEVAEERAAAREAITKLRLAPVMFEMGARPHPARDLYRAYLDQSHIFVGIYWQEYGWVAPGEEISGLEDEYRLSGDKPKLIYIKNPAPEREPRLKELLARIKSADTTSYKYFSIAGELRELIENDLALLLTESFEVMQAPPAKELPVGTLTFLFTDIEDSTKLWEAYPEAMRQGLARHDALVATYVEQHAGVLVRGRGEGDSHFAVFTRASDAAAAAGTLQQALFAEPWPTPTPLRVRIALNTGEADLRQGDYYGTAVNRCARLRAVAHGGQILLSRSTYDMARDSLPEDARLRDLGGHRLKDLAGPEHVYQLIVPGVQADFPPLKTAQAQPSNLPVPRNPLIDRERELTLARDLLLGDQVSLLTLTGPGGTGKSRLGLHIALDLFDHFEDGAFLVRLTPITDPNLVASAIAETLGIRETTGDQRLLDSLKAYLRNKRILLLLDNFEQVIASAPLIAELLEACPRVKMIVTSRAALRLRAERELFVPPLALPDLEHLPDAENLSQYAAVELFIQRASSVKPDFAITNENAPAVAEICHRLDGLPLAIELAATRIKMLPPLMLLARLENRLELLRGGARDLPARQQTLRGTIDWSYNLLDRNAQMLFRRLAVFVGGWTLDAGEAVCNIDDDLGINTLDEMEALVEISLLRRMEGPNGEPRFRMLATIHEYALERLMDSGEAELIRRQHSSFFLKLAEEAEPYLTSGERVTWLSRLETEHDNLRAVLAWSMTEKGDPAVGLLLAGALGWFWFFRGHWSEGRQWLDGVLARAGASSSEAVRGKALYTAGGLAWNLGDYASARSQLEESAAIGRALGPSGRRLVAYSLTLLGFAAISQGDSKAADAYSRESLDLLRELDAPWLKAFTLRGLGDANLMLGDPTMARSLFEESLAIFRSLDDAWGVSMMLNALGGMALARSDYAAAGSQYGESVTVLRDVGDKWGLGVALVGTGYAALHQGDVHRAKTLFEESLTLWRKLGSKAGIVMPLAGFAAMAAARGQSERAARLFGAAQALSEETGFLSYGAGRPEFERNLAFARTQLDEMDWEKAYSAGQAMTLDQAVAYALEDDSPA